MILKGNKSVKISPNMKDKLKSFMSKVKGGLKTVKYVPGSIFEVFKDVPKAVAALSTAKKEDKEKPKTKDKKPSTSDTKADEKDKDLVKPDSDTTNDATKTDTPAPLVIPVPVQEPKMDESSTKTKVIEPKKVDVKSILAQHDKQGKSENTKENDPIKPEKVIVEPKKAEKKEPEKPKKKKKDLKDLTAFDTYKEYKYAYFWNYYFNKYDADNLEKVAKDFAKGADVNAYRDLLSEAQFNTKRDEQLKAKEIAELKKAHAEELDAAEEKRQADVQAAKDESQAEIDDLTEKLTTARAKNRVLNSKLKADNEALEQIKEVIEPLGIAKIAEIISSAEEKCEDIDKRAEEREKAKAKETESQASPVKEDSEEPKSIDEQVNDIMKDINKNVYQDESKEEKTTTVEPQTEEDKKDVFSDLASAVSQVSEQKETQETANPEAPVESSVLDDLRNVDDIFPEQSNKDKTVIFHSNDPKLQGIGKFDDQNRITVDWRPLSSENNSEQDLDYMGYDPETRAEIGLKAQDIVNNSNGEISFNEALAKATQEFSNDSKSNGKTR